TTFLDRVCRSLRRFDACLASLAALEPVAPYFQETWVTARRTAIEKGLSNSTTLTELVEAVPTLVAYQEFRIRASRLGTDELAILRAFRSKEEELARLDPNDLDLCVRRTIGREARVSWK